MSSMAVIFAVVVPSALRHVIQFTDVDIITHIAMNTISVIACVLLLLYSST